MSNRKQLGNLLHSVHGGGQLEPGSKMMQIGLDHLNPVQALQSLVDNEELMSVALHEITHFDSLENSLGHVLGFLGHQTSFSAESIQQTLKARTPVDSDQLQLYLYLRSQYSVLLEIWRPLLEGLALYVQTSRPCTESDELVPAFSTLTKIGLELSVLDPPPELWAGTLRGDALFNLASHGILSTGYIAMNKGPSLGGDMLAAALELDTGPEWLPYFLGHAYVRALNDRLTKVSADFECPEVFMKLMLRVLYTSTERLLEPGEGRGDLESVDRVYNWIELFEQTPPQRIRELQNLDDNVDVLWFLETGERVAGYEVDLRSLSKSLSRLVPEVWKLFTNSIKNVDFDRIASKLGDEVDPNFANEAVDRFASALIVGTGSLNFSTRGDCSICGWIPKALDERHALALRVEQATWWLSLNDSELAALPYPVDAIPELPLGSLRPGSEIEISAADLPLTVSCYVTHTRYGLPAEQEFAHVRRFATCLFEFTSMEPSDWSLVTIVTSGEGRGFLKPAPQRTTQGLHIAAQKLRNSVVEFSSMALDQWAMAFEQNGQSESADRIRSFDQSQQLTLSQLRDLWARRILNGLLGTDVPNRIKRQIMTERMRVVLQDQPVVRNLLTGAYSGRCVVRLSKENWMPLLNAINQDAISLVGKPIFQIDNDTDSVKYLGLWGRQQ